MKGLVELFSIILNHWIKDVLFAPPILAGLFCYYILKMDFELSVIMGGFVAIGTLIEENRKLLLKIKNES